jgi:arabinose-5-phosphate isomerase
MQAALGDALAVALLESRGFTAVDFGKFHPGGRLGAMLKFVSDLMHTGSAIPLVALGTRMADAVVEMSTKGFGCVGVIDAGGRLVGILTDGDLRRILARDVDVRSAGVAEVMTRDPKTTSADRLAAEAVQLMRTLKINGLFVVDAERRVLGALNMHDLLRAGVV